MSKKKPLIKNVILFSVYLLIVWGVYRSNFNLPEPIDELLVKPILWLAPIIYLLKREHASVSSLGVTFKNLFPSLYFALALGAGFGIAGLIVSFIKYRGFDFTANIGNYPFFYGLAIACITATVEETTFRGYIFNRLLTILKKEWAANCVTSLIWAAMHVPVAVFLWKLALPSAAIYLGLIFLFGVGSAFVFARTKNIASSILLHVLWEWPVILFR